MIIQKIEKYSEISFCQENEGEKKAALQTCYYNLKNLKKIVERNLENTRRESEGQNNYRCSPRHRISQTNLMLPEISVSNARNQQLSCNSNNIQSRRSKDQLKHTYRSSSLLDMTNRLLPIRNNETLLNDLSAKYNLKSSKIETTCYASAKLVPCQNSKEKKPVKFRTRKEKPLLRLAKNQKYFEQTEINVSQEIVERLGLYEAANLYKKSTIQKFLNKGYQDKFKPVINLKFATFSLCNRNQFFLTDSNCLPELNEADSCGESSQGEETKKKTEKKVLERSPKQKSVNDSIFEKTLEEVKENKNQGCYKSINWLLTIQNYEVVKNEQYFGFKKDNINDWNDLKFILHTICLYLKKVKICLLSFKFEKNLFMKELWSCQRISDGVLERLLKIKLTVKDQEKEQTKTIKLFNSRAEVIKYLVQMWKDRQNLENMKKVKQKQRQRLVWSAIRITAKHKMRVAKRKRAARAQMLNEKLKNGDWDHEIEIHLPSFSENQFVRNTTQYMEHYQNMFYHIWKSSNKQFVLIIPAINQAILQLFQNKIKLSKNITLICPESHQLYPKSLPLSATLLYSKEALQKIRRILEGKRGIIIPGRQLSNQFLYEEHLSDLLNCPLFSTLNLSNFLGDNKNIWLKYDIPTAPFTVIQPKSSIQAVIQKFSQLLFEYPKTKIWVFKMNRQFNGRGIAIFDACSSKKLKQILSFAGTEGSEKETNYQFKLNERRKQQIKNLVISYLQVHFRLKLKINFENCIFRVEQFIQMFLQMGGIIEEFVEDCETFELSFKLEPGYPNYSHVYILDEIEEEKYICCTQNYEVDFVTKSSLFVNEVPKIVKDFSKRVQKLLKAERYLGYVSATVLYSPKRQQYYAVEIKPYMTINASMSFLLKVFTSKKPSNNPTNRRNGNLVSNSNIQSGEISYAENPSSKLMFLFIPCIIFTDVDEEIRSQIIENLVVESWEKISNKLFTQPIIADNPDTFHGTLYLSLGLALGILIYGKPHDLRKMKNLAIDCARELSDKIQSIKLYRGKQETRDVFQFRDLIRAVTKIKP